MKNVKEIINDLNKIANKELPVFVHLNSGEIFPVNFVDSQLGNRVDLNIDNEPTKIDFLKSHIDILIKGMNSTIKNNIEPDEENYIKAQIKAYEHIKYFLEQKVK